MPGVTPQQIVDTINLFTSKTQAAQNPAQQINVVNVALAVSGLGPIPVVITRLTDIVSTITASIPSISSLPPFTDKSDQDAIVKAVATYVQVSQAFLNILIGKSGLVTQLVPFVGPPIAQVLRQLESVDDTYLFEVLELVPDLAADLTKQKDSLDATLIQAIDAWSGGIVVPS